MQIDMYFLDNEIQLIQFDQSNTSNNDPDPNTLKMTVQLYSGETYDVDFYSPSFASTTGSETRCHYVGKLIGVIGDSFVSLSGCSLMKSLAITGHKTFIQVEEKSYNNNFNMKTVIFDLKNNSTKQVDEMIDLKENTFAHITIFTEKLPLSVYRLNSIGEVIKVAGDTLFDAVSDPHDIQSASLEERNGGYRKLSINNKLPARINVTVGFGYDKSVKEKIGNKSSVKTWLEETFIHMTTYYQHPSLQTKIELKV